MTALPNSGRVCQTCKHCDTRSVVYLCRAEPGLWPAVQPQDWCGEHEWSELHKPTAQAEVT